MQNRIHLKSKKQLLKTTFIIFVVFVSTYFVIVNNYDDSQESNSSGYMEDVLVKSSDEHESVVEKFFEKREKWDTSNLGTLLFKKSVTASSFKDHRQSKTFDVLVWKHYEWLKYRHIRGYNDSRSDPLDSCSVKNCIFSGDESLLNTADAILIHLQHGAVPKVERRNVNQRWIFLSDEAPKNTFSLTKNKPKLADLANVFNWSMTYRYDSDVPVPYGRTVAQPIRIPPEVSEADIIPYWRDKKTDAIATILISNCGVSYRMNYLKQLKSYMKVDVYGGCSDTFKDSCPGHFRADCNATTKYIFYLVFENSNCDQYLTEKAFYHAYRKGAIPVILGPPIEDCQALLPPHSFLHIDSFTSAKELAEEMIRISQSEEEILFYHNWRKDFHVVNEHGYFGTTSFHFCRLCEALNYNDEEIKTYDLDLLKFMLDTDVNCQ